jgi:hypothetical protein
MEVLLLLCVLRSRAMQARGMHNKVVHIRGRPRLHAKMSVFFVRQGRVRRREGDRVKSTRHRRGSDAHLPQSHSIQGHSVLRQGAGKGDGQRREQRGREAPGRASLAARERCGHACAARGDVGRGYSAAK